MAALPRRLATSTHLSFFHRRDAVFLYHDVWGYLLEMSADLVTFVKAFNGGVEVGPTLAASAFPLKQAHGFAAVLAAHEVLVEPGVDAIAGVLDAYPVKAKWRVALHHDDGSVDVVQGRNLHADRRVIRLRGMDAQLWHGIDGERTCRQLAAHLHQQTQADRLDAPATPLDEEEAHTLSALERQVCARISTWTHSDWQWTRVSTAPMTLWQGRVPPYLTSTMPYARLTDAGVHDPFRDDAALGASPKPPGDDLGAAVDGSLASVVQTANYHRETVKDADAQFDDVETTLSHLFRDPHPALQGRTWAAALREALVERDLWRADTKDVVEVGGGLGWFALRMLQACPEPARAQLSYRILDIAPALQSAQRERLASVPEASCHTCDAETLDLPDASVDLLISNEVIADLRTAWVTRAEVEAARAAQESAADEAGLAAVEARQEPGLVAVIRYDLPIEDAPERFALNLGAMHMIDRMAHVLKPGGAAILTEFGHRHAYPVESTQLDHPEFSIQFSHLAHVAQRVGLEAEIVSVPELVRLDGAPMALRSTQTWWANLRFLAAQHGIQLAKRAWTLPMLQAHFEQHLALDRLEGLYWQPIGERTMGLVPEEFLALIVRKAPVNVA